MGQWFITREAPLREELFGGRMDT
ncbi:unnamed protein product [Linum tenue]|uniref:Uncharacterized protein n=1 Tax=Linum tenue TaxID=586396 RepID=A0AAV0KRS0_9ROSI|nr:unnamed protein product [Linum tenue]